MKSFIFPKLKPIAREISTSGIPNSPHRPDCQSHVPNSRNFADILRYAFATLFGNLGGIRSCNVYTLRLFNVLALTATMAYVGDCRALITRAWRRESKDERAESERLSANFMHTAFNIALFPPLFFFSGLFYTDVLSTCVVLRMYRLFLQRNGSIWLYVAGILALTMRQTNIFWVAVFMSGLEAVRTIKSIEAVQTEQASKPQTWRETAISEFQRYSRGEIHDIPLYDAELQGTFPVFTEELYSM
jgi:alpha-1,2-glucosyltransferase